MKLNQIIQKMEENTTWVVPIMPKEPGMTMEAHLIHKMIEEWEGKK